MSPWPELKPGEVHVWQAPLTIEPDRSAHFRHTLSAEEVARADRLRAPELGRRFIAGRGFLREILAGYLGMAAEAVQIGTGTGGKPRLSEAEADIRFNLSHSGEFLLVAVTFGYEVGIDLEEMRQELSFGGMARRYFSDAECAELFQLPSHQQLGSFYRCWTRKEAYLKGTGTGFGQACNLFDVSLLPGQPPRLLRHRSMPQEASRWRLHDLSVPEGYCGALAVAGDELFDGGDIALIMHRTD